MKSKLKQLGEAAAKTMLSNKQLFKGVGLGALLMLLAGLYINERASNPQSSKQPGNVSQIEGVNMNGGSRQLIATGQNEDHASGQNVSGHNVFSDVHSPTPTSNNAYKPPVCTKTPTSFATHVLLATWLGSNQTKVDGGKEGYTEVCAADSTGYVPHNVPLNPVDKYIYVGTGGVSATTPPRTSPPEPDQYNRIVADCSQQLAVHGNQDAYQLCVSTLSRYFGL